MKNTHDGFWVLTRTHRGGAIAGAIGILLVGAAVQSQAQEISIPNSSATFASANGALGNWTLGGSQQMDQESFYYSVGSGDLYSIGSISAGTTPSETSSGITEKYANSTLGLTTAFQLGPVGSGGANLSTTISLQNLSGSSQTFHFFQLSYFDLGGTLSGQNVQFLGTTVPYQVIQTGNGETLTGTLNALGGGQMALVEEIAGIYDGSNFGLQIGSPAPAFSDSPLSASGDVDFAYEISATLGANSSLTISEFQAVPEPSPVALILACLAGGLFVPWLRVPAFSKK
ncbi:MAG: hypothetical protein ACRED1_07845 [Limisphaerales bacterium]